MNLINLLITSFSNSISLIFHEGARALLRWATPRRRSGAAAALCWSSHEERPRVQGKRNSGKTVDTGRGDQRADRLKPHRQLANLITWITALSNSMKLSHAVWGHPGRMGHGGGLTERRQLEKGMANHFSILTLRSPWTVWKDKKIGHWKMNSPGWLSAQYAIGDQWRNNSRKNEGMSQRKNNTQLWMGLVMEARFHAVKSNVA